MKLVKSITVEDALDNGIFPKKLRKTPPGVLTTVWRKGHGVGVGVDLAWYRGRHAGLYDAYLTLKASHPRIAEEFRKAVGFDNDGAFRSAK